MKSATVRQLNGERIARDVITIGASAGGFQALTGLLSRIPEDIPAVIALVLHRSPYSQGALAMVLERLTGRRFFEPTGGEPLERGRIYLAPRDQHMLLENDGVFVERGAKEHATRPAVDPLFRSAAASYGPRVVGVLLSGAGDDGVVGLIHVKRSKGLSLVQAPEQAEHPSMPVNAIRFDSVDAILPVDQLAMALSSLAQGASFEPPSVPVFASKAG
jgi:two-component system chemotaxis response regulator CheB